MKNKRFFGFFLAIAVVACVMFVAGDLWAQKRGGKGGSSDQQRKKSEEAVKETQRKAEEAAKEEAEQQKGKKGEAEKGKKLEYKPKGLSEEDMKQWEGGNPPGWSMGTKKGWEGADAPPGKMKKGDEAKLEQAKERIRNRIRTHEGKGETERKQLEECAERSIEGAVRSGVPVEQAEKTVEKGIERGMTGEEIEKVTRAMAYGADKETDYDELGTFMDKKMEEGERGNELAMSMYKKIDEQQAEKPQVQEEVKEKTKVETKKKPWYKRIFGRD